MKRIKLISGLLAGALMLSSVVVPAKVQAKNVDLESALRHPIPLMIAACPAAPALPRPLW